VVVENNFSPPDEPGKRAMRRPDGVGENDFYIKIMDTRYEMQTLIGTCLGGEQCTFLDLVMAALPDADHELWV